MGGGGLRYDKEEEGSGLGDNSPVSQACVWLEAGKKQEEWFLRDTG